MVNADSGAMANTFCASPESRSASPEGFPQTANDAGQKTRLSDPVSNMEIRFCRAANSDREHAAVLCSAPQTWRPATEQPQLRETVLLPASIRPLSAALNAALNDRACPRAQLAATGAARVIAVPRATRSLATAAAGTASLPRCG